MKNKWHLALIITLLAMLSASISACGNTDASQPSTTANPGTAKKTGNLTCVQGNLQVTGSTALQPLAKDVATAYQQQCSGANITVGGGGSSTGLKNVQDGSSQIGNSDIFADKHKYPNLVSNQVAVVTFAVVINGDVKNISDLTTQQLRDIYSGKAKNWNKFGGPNLPIVAVSRPAGSGTRITFEQYVLGQKETITGNAVANASGEVSTTVSQTSGAVSYIAADFAHKNNLHVVKLNGVDDTDTNVVNNTYKFWNIEHMYTKGPATGLARAYIDYVKSPDVEPIRQKQGFLDISKMSPAALAAKTPENA
ncbi:phosphate ABC transporter substrate-binding protein [Dictyobacter kobayashii]|uniref:Phosphate-binding protein n=1 Tax=Dictyobacter kobayashii TaxID=2014872 RepID=A0A402AJI0_9CHLR|nr:phosphate ABC transporter substrate-binding protein [Dictyobacter kobayashii]GCE19224.1 phosphate-binding protein [Dictyobacter kobayashii]